MLAVHRAMLHVPHAVSLGDVEYILSVIADQVSDFHNWQCCALCVVLCCGSILAYIACQQCEERFLHSWALCGGLLARPHPTHLSLSLSLSLSVADCSAMLWITFAPVSDDASDYFDGEPAALAFCSAARACLCSFLCV
jgi:hypothetical protein